VLDEVEQVFGTEPRRLVRQKPDGRQAAGADQSVD